MAAIDWDDVVAHAADLADVDTDAQADILGYVNENVNVAKFGGETSYKLKLARIYLAAHLGQMTLEADSSSGVTGDIESETIGAESITFDYSKMSDGDELELTQHGLKYRGLVRRSACRVGFVPGC